MGFVRCFSRGQAGAMCVWDEGRRGEVPFIPQHVMSARTLLVSRIGLVSLMLTLVAREGYYFCPEYRSRAR